jgi:hypothetical protein
VLASAALLAAYAATAVPLRAGAADAGADPDMGGPSTNLDPAAYLALRQQQIDILRGTNSPVARTSRLHAIQQATRARGAAGAAAPLGLSGPGGTWVNLGPAPIPNGQTKPSSVAVSGRVSAIAVDPTDPNIAYVGAAQGGVWRTLNGGTTWAPIFDSAGSLAIGAIAIAPSDHTKVYVGTGEANGSCDSFDGVGVYRIDNANATPTLDGPMDPAYSPTGTGSFGGLAISQILVKPDDPATIFVSTTLGVIGIGCDLPLGGTQPPIPPLGVWRSTNATAAAPTVTFTKVTVNSAGSFGTDTTGNRAITDMVLDPSDGTSSSLLVGLRAFTGDAASVPGVYRSTNALAATPTFSRTLAMGSAGIRIAFAAARVSGPTPTGTVYAGTSESIGTGASFRQGRLRVSTDGGATWGGPLTAADGFCQPQCSYDINVAVPPPDPTTIYLGGSVDGTTITPTATSYQGIIEKSTDSGASFSNSCCEATLHADNHAIALAPSNSTIIYDGNDGGVWKSTNSGATWSTKNTNLNITQFQSIAVHPTDPNFTLGGSQDNGTVLRKADSTYTRADFGDGGYALIDQTAADTTTVTMYHTYFNASTATTKLMGFARVDTTATASDGNWVFKGCQGATGNGITCDPNVNFYAPMALGPGTPNTVYFGTDRLYRSTNKGDMNTLVSQGPLVAGVPISAIGISPQNDAIRLVGLNNGKVFLTTTGSSPLTDVTPATGYKAQYVSRVVIDPNNFDIAYITLAGYMGDATAHVWQTTDLTAATPVWSQMASGIPDVPVDAFAINPDNTSMLFAGTDIGVYRSTDGGTSWSPFGTGLPTVAVFDMAVTNPAGSRVLRIATHGRGQWEIPLSSGTVTPEVPWTPLMIGAGALGIATLAGRRLRRPLLGSL